MIALWVAIITAASKEALFRYLFRVAERLRSPMLAANAWHTRADAASALVVVVGIAGALMGWTFLDLLAAAIMGFMILRMGLKLAWDSLQELIDTALDKEKVEAIRRTLLETPGVLGLHELRTRRMAHQRWSMRMCWSTRASVCPRATAWVNAPGSGSSKPTPRLQTCWCISMPKRIRP